ncbi:hypothetical protein M9H77_11912 [Catharanthus roseus]|uniref:Uncharacterized protein n=1 Tax=Catharanthus roseus TaxID=4058 RepID=A0ACC0BG32_CATRO|nr:hypothetical protein M9H77_11912 [Catharanthus roseus]
MKKNVQDSSSSITAAHESYYISYKAVTVRTITLPNQSHNKMLQNLDAPTTRRIPFPTAAFKVINSISYAQSNTNLDISQKTASQKYHKVNDDHITRKSIFHFQATESN